MRFYAGLDPAFAGLNAGVISPAQGLSAVEVHRQRREIAALLRHEGFVILKWPRSSLVAPL
jgi:hypothetical protein